MDYQYWETKQYYLSSNSDKATKLNGSYKSKMRFQIPNLIKNNENSLYSVIKLSHTEIPYSFYIINDYNNILKINATNIHIENGSYSATKLLDLINTQLEQINTTLKLSINSTNGILTLKSNQYFTIDTTISQIYKIIGLEKGIYNGIFEGTQYSLTFTYPLDLLGTRNIYIKTPNIIMDNLNLSSGDKTTLKSIPVNASPFGIITYTNLSNTESHLKTKETDYLDIELTDDSNNYIDFNGIDWNICIEIKTLINSKKQILNINDVLNMM